MGRHARRAGAGRTGDPAAAEGEIARSTPRLARRGENRAPYPAGAAPSRGAEGAPWHSNTSAFLGSRISPRRRQVSWRTKRRGPLLNSVTGQPSWSAGERCSRPMESNLATARSCWHAWPGRMSLAFGQSAGGGAEQVWDMDAKARLRIAVDDFVAERRTAGKPASITRACNFLQHGSRGRRCSGTTSLRVFKRCASTTTRLTGDG